MKERRTVREQVKSGFRIAGSLVLVFCFFAALVASLSYVTGRADRLMGNHRWLAALVAVALITIMFLTTQYWAKWLVGVLGYCFLRMLAPLFFKLFFGFFRELTFAELLMWTLYSLAAAALTARHVSRAPKGVEKFGLVAFVVCVSLAMVYGSVPLFYGLGLLATAELIQKLLSHDRQRQDPGIASARRL